MTLPYSSLQCAPRSLLILAAVWAATLVGCGDDDDDAKPGKDAGAAGNAGEKSAGSGATSGKGGRGGDGAGGKGGSSGQGGNPAPDPDDAGIDMDAGGDPEPTGFRDLSIEMTGFADEVGEFMQFRLVASNGEILTMAALHGLPLANFTYELPDSIPAGQEVELQVWGDTAGTVANAYDAAMDHAWTATIAADDADAPAVVMLEHGAQTPPPTVGAGDAAGSMGFLMMDTGAYSGDIFEMRVHENVGGRLVGRQVLPVPGSEVAFEVYGVIRTGSVYRVDFAIDDNENLSYDGPPTDPSWRRTVTGTATGYNSGPGATLTLAAPPAEGEYVDVGF